MAKTKKNLTVCCKLWVEKNGLYAFGSGITDILFAIQSTGSIKEAAACLGESYRYTWGRIRKVEQVLGVRLVETMLGGTSKERTHLTASGENLLKLYRKFDKAVTDYTNRQFKRTFKQPLF